MRSRLYVSHIYAFKIICINIYAFRLYVSHIYAFKMICINIYAFKIICINIYAFKIICFSHICVKDYTYHASVHHGKICTLISLQAYKLADQAYEVTSKPMSLQARPMSLRAYKLASLWTCKQNYHARWRWCAAFFSVLVLWLFFCLLLSTSACVVVASAVAFRFFK